MATEIQVRKQKLATGKSKRGSENEESADKSPGGSTNKRNQDIENQYQKIKTDLSKDIAKGLAAVEKVGDQIKVRLASQGSFVSGGANLQPEFQALLGRVGKSLSASKGKMRVEGHTDNVPVAYNGRFKSNWDLSAQRSASVAQFFINEAGFKERNVTVAGFADTRPIARNDSAAGRAKNRRIDIIVDGK